jgi:diaminopimelate decarboxylase
VIGFYRIQSSLMCDGVVLTPVADRVGTPFYLYSAATIRQTYSSIDEAFSGYPHTIHYALKANSTMAIARLLRQLGSSVDANSVGEIEIALRAGFVPSQIVFTGVGKTDDELERAVDLGVGMINAESAGEIERLDRIARSRGTRARVAIRLNPDVDPKSHPHISTGLKTNKFGVPIEEAAALYRGMRDRAGISLVGIHVHIGSQIVTLDPVRRATRSIATLARELVADGIPLEQIDVGGGLGISYDSSAVPSMSEYASTVLEEVRSTGLHLALEPGRAMVAAAGALVAAIVDVKEFPGGKRFLIVDAGMNDLLRPALYGAFHRIESLETRDDQETAPYDVVGPICESSDIFGRDRVLPVAGSGDRLAILDAGAYGSAMSSTYNRRPLAAEVMVDEGRWRIIRRRQTIDDLLALEE